MGIIYSSVETVIDNTTRELTNVFNFSSRLSSVIANSSEPFSFSLVWKLMVYSARHPMR